MNEKFRIKKITKKNGDVNYVLQSKPSGIAYFLFPWYDYSQISLTESEARMRLQDLRSKEIENIEYIK